MLALEGVDDGVGENVRSLLANFLVGELVQRVSELVKGDLHLANSRSGLFRLHSE